MKRQSFLSRVHAAHALTIAMTDGVQPSRENLKALGLSADLAKRFKR